MAWRIFAMEVMLVALVILAPRLADLAIPQSPSPWHAPLVALRNLAVAFAMLAVYGFSVRIFERRSAAEISPRPAHFFIGAATGAALISFVYGVLLVSGHAVMTKGTGLEGLGYSLVGMFGAVLFEELLVRAIFFRIVEQAFGTTAAIVISAVLFGLLHGFNNGSSWTSDIAVALEAGILLALAYVLTRNIWLAVGIHLGWNFTEGSFYGAAVSGTTPTHTYLRTTLSGAPSLTGGLFGPEASWISIAVCLVGSAFLFGMVLRHLQWQPARFRVSLP
jgi:membrane protease YdiL (CAAX protease family)